jgi:hypothetical protein
MAWCPARFRSHHSLVGAPVRRHIARVMRSMTSRHSPLVAGNGRWPRLASGYVRKVFTRTRWPTKIPSATARWGHSPSAGGDPDRVCHQRFLGRVQKWSRRGRHKHACFQRDGRSVRPSRKVNLLGCCPTSASPQLVTTFCPYHEPGPACAENTGTDGRRGGGTGGQRGAVGIIQPVPPHCGHGRSRGSGGTTPGRNGTACGTEPRPPQFVHLVFVSSVITPAPLSSRTRGKEAVGGPR